MVAEERLSGLPEIMHWCGQEGVQFGNEERGLDELEVERE